MNIHENTALLDAFVDGELSAAELANLQAHLDICSDCQSYVDDALTMRAAFPTEETVELPADFTQHILEAVAKSPQSQPKKQPWGKLVAAAACLALIVTVQHFGIPGGTNTADTTAAYAADYAAPMERSVEAPAETQESAICEDGPAMQESTSEKEATQMDTAPTLTDTSALSDFPVVRVSAAELGDLLTDFTPEETAPGYTRYLLTREEFETLAAQLAEQEIILSDETGAPQLWLEVCDT